MERNSRAGAVRSYLAQFRQSLPPAFTAILRAAVALTVGCSLLILFLRPARAAAGFALVIASGDYMPGSPYAQKTLTGPRADGRLMASMLVWRFGFQARNIRFIGMSQSDAAQVPGAVVLSQHATAAAIQQGFSWLADVARNASDPVVIFYAGHGKRVSNPDRLARDVNSEALVPYDADAFDSNLVRDVQVKTWLNQIASRRKTVIMDCCFSGDLIREVGDAEGLPGGRVVRGIGSDKDTRSPMDRPARLRNGRAAIDTRNHVMGDDLPPGTVLLAACGKKESAYEKRLLPTDGRPATGVGEFTWALYRVLCQNQTGLSYDTLRARVEERLRQRGLTQTPVVLGANGAEEAIAPTPWTDHTLRLPVQSSSGQEFALGIGWFSGLRANRVLVPAGTGPPIHLSELGWFDVHASGLRAKDRYLAVQQFP